MAELVTNYAKSEELMATEPKFGGIVHTYQKYDPVSFPNPSSDAPDLVSPAFEHMMHYGSLKRLTEEQLARAVQIDPSQIQGFGPTMERLMEVLEARKRKILETFETESVSKEAKDEYENSYRNLKPPKTIAEEFKKATKAEQLNQIEDLWYKAGGEKSPFGNKLLGVFESLAIKYQVDELASKYEFTGTQSLDVPKALEVKAELEKIDELLKQLKDAMENAQIGVINMEELSEFLESGDMDQLNALQKQIQEMIKAMQENQGIDSDGKNLKLTPKAYKIFQSKLLGKIFDQLKASRSGRHMVGVSGEGAVETQKTKPFEFGDSLASLDIQSSIVNMLVRSGGKMPEYLHAGDLVVNKTKNNPKCATVVLLDMSGSMRYDGQYVNVKRMGLALDGLIRSEYPGDRLHFVEMYTFAKIRSSSEIVSLMPKPVTVFDPVVRLKADMSDPDITEMDIPPHFTNIQHGLQQARNLLANSDTCNKQVMIVTDGLPTAHFEGKDLYLFYPPDPRTEAATLKEAMLCAREGITVNVFLMSSWNQSTEDVQFAYKMAQSSKGRVIFVAGKDLDRYVIWDYLSRRKTILG
jgi:uncharacterized protein with von Willebrand factor type A (vWA) domain